jgi:hypothetical protein
VGKPTNAAIVDLNGRTWQPFESLTPTGHVSYTEDTGEIHVPYGTDPVSLTIQAHELSHVRYTAKVWPDVKDALTRLTGLAGTTSNIVGYAEDMRITALAGRLGVKTLPAFGDKHDADIITRWVDSFVNAGIPRERVEAAVKFILNEHTSVLARIGLDGNTLQLQANAERYIVHCAQHLHNLLSRGEDDSKSDSSKTPEKGDGKADSTKGEKKDKSEKDKSDKGDKSEDDKSKSEDGDEDGKDGDAGDDSEAEGDSPEAGDGPADGGGDEGDEGEDGDTSEPSEPAEGGSTTGARSAKEEVIIDLSKLALPDIRQAMLRSVPPPVDTAKLIQTFQHTLDTADWIPVPTIERMPLVRRAAQSRNRGRKLSEVGVTLGSAYDAVAPNERRPFVAKRKGGVGGLTVAIDCSGSMHIDTRQLEQLLLKHPQGVVVTYSSDCSSYRGDKAIVRVIASHGRLAAAEDFRNYAAGGNGCDGPVLEWLTKQSGERVWVCDGIITGKGDRQVFYNDAARDAWLKAHKITRFDSLTEYIASLTR